MTFKELQDEIILLRFNEAYRSRIKKRLNQSYLWLWNYSDDWLFKTASSDLPVTALDNSPAMPADFGRSLDLYDENGEPLCFVPRARWERDYLPPTAAPGSPVEYTVINRQIYLGPTPALSATFQLAYKRRVSHVDPVLGIIGGVLLADGDQPLWPAEHDDVLVCDAMIRLLRYDKDDGYKDLVEMRDELLVSMVGDLAVEKGGGNLQFGRTPLV